MSTESQPLPLIRPAIRRRVQNVTPDAAQAFLMQQRHGRLFEQLLNTTEPSAEEPIETAKPSPPQEIDPFLVNNCLTNPRELDKYWGRMLDALGSGRICPKEGRQLAKSLGQIRQTLAQSTPKDRFMK